MYLLLLAFGTLLAAAGIVLAAFGVSIHDHSFDTSIITPGIVAAVGGLLLIGLGLALRVLARIERAIKARAEPPSGVDRAAQPEPALLHAPSLVLHPQTAPSPAPVATAPPAAADERPSQSLPEKSVPETSPLMARLEASRALAGAEATRPADAAMPFSTSVDAAVAQVDRAQAVKRKNGAASPRLAQRLDIGARPPAAAERPQGPSFEALWPKPSRPVRAPTGAAAPAPLLGTGAAPADPAPIAQPDIQVSPASATDVISVLKSGVVDGMAYTLYSDGSIEAQLPQGTLRFGSITELRNHIEQSA